MIAEKKISSPDSASFENVFRIRVQFTQHYFIAIPPS